MVLRPAYDTTSLNLTHTIARISSRNILSKRA